MDIKDGGPAFPQTLYDSDSIGRVVPREFFPGMSLRDYFAAKALPHILSRGGHIVEAAQTAYLVADAMLRSRTTIGGKE